MAESTIGQLKAELIHRRGPWRTVAQLEYAVFEYSTGGTTAGCTGSSACSPRPKRRPSTTLNHGHCQKPVLNSPSPYRTQCGSPARCPRSHCTPSRQALRAGTTPAPPPVREP